VVSSCEVSAENVNVQSRFGQSKDWNSVGLL
jgi:hypothetical protein